MEKVIRGGQAIVIGGGLLGISTSYFLSVHLGKNVVLITRDPPLSVTSSVSTEAYRTFWGADNLMSAFVERSLCLMEDLAGGKDGDDADGSLDLGDQGYLYVARDPEVVDSLRSAASVPSSWPSPPLLFLNSLQLHERYPWLSSSLEGGLLASRCGFLNANELGSYLLQRSRLTGRFSTLLGEALHRDSTGSVLLCSQDNGATHFGVALDSDTCIVNCAGPWMNQVHSRLQDGDKPLPLVNKLHCKTSVIDNTSCSMPNSAPMVIGMDSLPVNTLYGEDEMEVVAEFLPPQIAKLESFPPGVHCRPAGASRLLIWEFVFRDQHRLDHSQDPSWPIDPGIFSPMYGELCLSAMARYVPGFKALRNQRVRVDGGWYACTPDGRPLIGHTAGSNGNYIVCGGVAGYGVMSSLSCGALAAKIATGTDCGSDDCDFLEGFSPMREMGPPKYTGISNK